jgi:NAD+ diphosphatase
MNFCPECGSQLTTKEVDGSTRYVCTDSTCHFVHWNNPVPVVAALVKHDDKYIIARNVKWPKGVFSVISGYLEEGESPEAATLREVTEELGLAGRITHHIGNYMFREKNQLILCYEVEATGKLVTNHELAETKQLPGEELARYDFSPFYITEKIIRDWRHLRA